MGIIGRGGAASLSVLSVGSIVRGGLLDVRCSGGGGGAVPATMRGGGAIPATMRSGLVRVARIGMGSDR